MFHLWKDHWLFIKEKGGIKIKNKQTNPVKKKKSGTGFESNHIFLVNSENKATNDHRLKYKGLQKNIKWT